MADAVVGVIPARYGSTRFPAKVLAPVAGVPMVVAVARQALKARGLDRVIVATDHAKVQKVCEAAGLEVLLTDPGHQSGTDRMAEVAKRLRGVRNFVNIQGDEPLIPPKLIGRVAALSKKHPDDLATAACALVDEEEWRNPNVVKVVCRKDGRALTFSRSPIPYPRSGDPLTLARRHIGIYGYGRELLLWYARQPQVALEQVESLEQLRLMVLGRDVRVLETTYRPLGVDTPEDLEDVNRLLAAGGQGV